jgi:8-oxo-dGTP pyrophosphatase MutT (NUDIX family)
VLRELYEETGLRGTVTRLLDVRSEVFPPWKEHSALQLVGFIFEVAAFGTPTVVEQQGSTIAAEWVPFAEVRSRPVVGLVDHALELLA